MSKGTLTIDVKARTDKAQKEILGLREKLEKTGLGELGSKFKGIPGLDKITTVLDAIPKGATAAAAAIGGVALGVKAVWSAMGDLVEKGKEAQRTFENFETTMNNLQRNIGGSGVGDFTGIGKELQFMAANGVNPFEELSSGLQQLTLAYGGNTTKALEMIKVFDDLSAGTNVAVSDWASMASEVENTGVSIKDLTRLSNRGIPIYQALGKAMGETAEQAEAMAKAGMISSEDWVKAIKNLRENYRGLSQEMSAKTLEGAQNTFESSSKLKYQGAAEGYSKERIEGLNELSDRMQSFAKDPVWQETIGVIGSLRAAGENWVDGLKESLAEFKDDFLVGFLNIFADVDGLAKAQVQTKQAQKVADATRGVAEAVSGKLTVGQMEDLLKQMQSGRLKYQDAGLSSEMWLKMITRLEEALAKAREADAQKTAKDEAAAKEESARQAKIKFGDLDEQIKAISGKDGIPIILDPAELETVIDGVKKRMMSGDLGLKEGEDMLKTLEPLQKKYVDQLKAEADAKEKARRETEKIQDDIRDAAKDALAQQDTAKKDKERADNKVADAWKKLEDAQIDALNRKVALQQKGIYSGEEIKEKVGKMTNYNDWMKMYEKSAAEGITRAEWRRKYGKVKDMDAAELERSGLFKKDKEFSKEDAAQRRAEEELAKAQKEQKEANQRLKEAGDKINNLAQKLGTTNEQITKFTQQQQDAYSRVITGDGKVRAVATAMTS